MAFGIPTKRKASGNNTRKAAAKMFLLATEGAMPNIPLCQWEKKYEHQLAFQAMDCRNYMQFGHIFVKKSVTKQLLFVIFPKINSLYFVTFPKIKSDFIVTNPNIL
ncbi:hypothetical protein AGMMS49982_10340 [Bacteroidia bacterium]|nr:hypothetical protein AGMMS49982_10340 [Bacteroidia bacterium]